MDTGKVLLDMIVAANSIKDAARLIYDTANPKDITPTVDEMCRRFFGLPAVDKKEEAEEDKPLKLELREEKKD